MSQCFAINCLEPATLAMILEVDSSRDSDFYHPPYSFLRKVEYCDDDFGFFYRSLSHSYTLVEVKILRPFGEVDGL